MIDTKRQFVNFFDTSVLIAASIPTHVHHTACHARLAAIRQTGGVCAAHSMAEAFSVLTRLPVPYRLTPADAMRIIDSTREYSTFVVLTETEVAETLQSLAKRGLGGGLAFDALLLSCARKAKARLIYTSNVKHFRLIAPNLASRIVEP
jgi:predicted nucleic acid-binding protein